MYYLHFTLFPVTHKEVISCVHIKTTWPLKMNIVNVAKELSVLIQDVYTEFVTVGYQDSTLAVCGDTAWSE